MLKSLGFTESEADIYLLCLELGPSPVQDIARRADVSRMTTYTAIESLSKRGLVSSVNKGKKTLYAAESPERLISFVQTRVRDIEATLREVQSSIEELKLKQRGEKPVVKLFEGPEALKVIEDDLIASKPSKVNEFGNLDVIRKMYPKEERTDFFDQLAKISPENHSILIDATAEIGRHSSQKKEILVLDPEKTGFSANILVYGNKVALSTFKNKMISVLIESQEMADTFRTFFTVALSRK